MDQERASPRIWNGGAQSPELLAFRADLLFAIGDGGSPAAYDRALLVSAAPLHPYLFVKKSRAQLSLGDVPGALGTLGAVEQPEGTHELVLYLTVRATLDWLRGDMPAAQASEERLSQLARTAGDLRALTEAIMVRGMVSHGRGTLLDDLRADLLSAERAGEQAVVIHEGHLCMAEGYLYGGEPYPKIERFARELLQAAEHSGARRAVAFATCLLGETELLTGNLNAAEQHLAQAARLSLDVGSIGAAALALQRQAEARIAARAYPEARTVLDQALRLGRESLFIQRHVLQRIYGARIGAASHPEDAMAMVDEAEVAIVGPGEGCQACLIACAIPAAQACARVGEIERAERYLGMASQMADVFWRTGGWHAAVAETRGVLLSVRGDIAQAQAEWQRASEMFRVTGQRLDAERCTRLAGIQQPEQRQ